MASSQQSDSPARRGGVYPALLRHWRHARGLSQLDLAIAADVSSRHISFLETGRSAPGAAMVVRLATALDAPLHATNEMLLAAGHSPRFPETPADTDPLAPIRSVVEVMKSHHDPQPLVVLDRCYAILDLNRGAEALLMAAVADLGTDRVAAVGMNLARLTLDPEIGPAIIVNHREVARDLLWRIHHEMLGDARDEVAALYDDLVRSPLVDQDWRDPDPTIPAAPSLELVIRAGPDTLRFVVTVTALLAPLMVGIDDVRVEQWFAADPATVDACERILRGQSDAAT
ncbi:MmyB family transcriptional regulator [Williamsia sp. M5A3_1d]